ncbi:hypothetical protein [Qaidamihabitans albus]|uniref:hypothetical protein n=1 Tax=Qaidamihabitans albus TaxID=2795733 RepID=UPI001F3C64F3|nr:hypothetical protein [Qaidamihabitans albus]
MNRYHFSSVFDLKIVGPSPRAMPGLSSVALPMQSATNSHEVSVSAVDFSWRMNLLQGVEEPGSRSSLVNR